ncbi:MAG: outer membrane protein assembly factor BamD [Pseudomonadota bacterium]
MTNGIRSIAKLAVCGGMCALVLAAGGCSSSDSAQKLLNPDPPEKMYARADAYMGAGRYEAAAHRFEQLDRNHPYSKEARRAIVMAAYAYYKAGKFPEAIATAKRYTVMHPGTKEAPFAHYIIGSAYFDEMNGPKNDQSSTVKALNEFKTLQSRYPNSEYARQADNRMRIAEDMLAAHEMEVGRYYLKRKNYIAAINRFKTVAKDYQTTKHVEEALMRLTESYMALGIKHEAQTAAAILGHNFPNSPWYKDAYDLLQSDGLAPRNSGNSWLSQAWQGFKLPKLSLGGG